RDERSRKLHLLSLTQTSCDCQGTLSTQSPHKCDHAISMPALNCFLVVDTIALLLPGGCPRPPLRATAPDPPLRDQQPCLDRDGLVLRSRLAAARSRGASVSLHAVAFHEPANYHTSRAMMNVVRHGSKAGHSSGVADVDARRRRPRSDADALGTRWLSPAGPPAIPLLSLTKIRVLNPA